MAKTTASYCSSKLSSSTSSADIDSGAEPNILSLQLAQPALDHFFWLLEVRDAVSQQATKSVIPLKHKDLVAGAPKLLGRGKSGRTRSDNGDGLPSRCPVES